MADNSRAINRVFTRKVISDLVQDGKSDVFDYVVKRYVEDPSGKTHGQLISEIYTRLNQQQRNEYFYMNTLLNKLLCGIHNVNTTVAFSQVRIEHSIADFVMINGEGRVYEIKSILVDFIINYRIISVHLIKYRFLHLYMSKKKCEMSYLLLARWGKQ